MKFITLQNIPVILLCIFSFLLSLLPAAIPITIVFIIVSICINYKYLNINKKYLPLFYLSSLFYLLHAVSYMYSVNKNDSLFDLQVKLSLFIWPLIFLFLKPTDIKKYNIILLSYLLGCFVSSFILIYNGIICYMKHSWIECFSGSYISPNFHTTYIAVYYVFCVNILLYFISNYSSFVFKISKKLLMYLSVFLIMYFLVLIVQLQSKGAFISLLATLGVNTFFLIKKINLKQQVVIITVLTLSICTPFILSSSIRERFINSFKVINKPIAQLVNYSNVTKDGSAARKIAWYVSVNKIAENPLGYGNGSVKKILTDEYIKLNWQIGQDMYINSHNQYLQTMLSVGLQGLLTLVAILFLLFYISVKNKNMLLLNLLVICVINFMFESMFELQAGIVYIWFFICFLYYKPNTN